MATQKDIARTLGVSVTLVSRVLAGKAAEIGAAPSTVRSIRQTAERLGYVPNATARILKGAPARTLGVVVYDFEDPFLGAITGALQRLAHAHDYTLVLAGFEQRHVDTQALRALTKHGVNGLIIVGSDTDDAWLASFRNTQARVARIGSGPAAANQATFAVDDGDGIDKVLRHLASQGYRTVGFVGDQHPAHQRRLRRFNDQAEQHGLTVRPEWRAIRTEPLPHAGYAAAQALMAGGGKTLPRAVVAASDALALGAIRAFQERGLGVPQRIAVTGFDDIPFADMITPALTTVRQPVADMAAKAFEWVTSEPRQDGDRPGPTLLFKPELTIRESA